MAANRQPFYTLDEYFAIVHVGDARYEYWDGDIICMSGGSKEHGQISSNIHFLLRLAIRGKKCQAFTAEQAIHTPWYPPFRYPDASVVCGPAEFEKVRGIDTLVNPIVLVEVLSPSSAERDKTAKLDIYKKLASLQEYLCIDQEQPLITHYRKRPDGQWSTATITDKNGVITVAALDCTLALSDIYENVEFAN